MLYLLTLLRACHTQHHPPSSQTEIQLISMLYLLTLLYACHTQHQVLLQDGGAPSCCKVDRFQDPIS
eukprot:1161680-Pelagomonas_calceolata.AAC.5